MTALAAIALINSASPAISDSQTSSKALSLHQTARRLSQEGRWQEALQYELRAASQAPDSALPHKGLSCIYSELGDNKKALEEAEKAVRLSPTDGDAHLNLATILQSSDRHLDALAQYQEASRLNDKDLPAMQGQAQCLMALGRFSDAERMLVAINKSSPKNKSILLNLAMARSGMGDLNGAEQAAHQVLALEPNSYSATHILAEIALDDDRSFQAVPLARKLIAIEPKNRVGYLFLGRCLALIAGWPEEMTKLVSKAKSNLPNDAKLFEALADNSADTAKKIPRDSDETLALRQRWWNAATQAIQAAVIADPKSAGYRLQLAQLLMKQRKYHEAAAEVESARSLDPSTQEVKAFRKITKPIDNDIAGRIKWWLRTQARS